MKFHLKILIALFACLLFNPGMKAAGQDANGRLKDEPAISTDSTATMKKEIPRVADFIKPSAVKHSGMFNVYEQDDKYFLEVPDKLLGRDILVFVSLIKGSAQLARSNRDMYGFGGDALFNKVIRFEKGAQNKLFIQEPIFATGIPDPTSALAGAVEASSMMPIAIGFDVKAKTDSSVLVDITDAYKSDHNYFSLKGATEMLNLGAYQAGNSYPSDVSAFDNNVIFRSVRSYAKGKAPKDNPNAVLNETTWEVASSWFLLPEKPMQARYYDSRIGYFAYKLTDYAKNPLKAEDVYIVSRWRLEPKPEDMDKYRRGELVEPVRPIVFYIDPNTPEFLQPYVISAVNAWQPVFELAGFKNAIIGRMMPTPEEDPEFSIEDARYSVISYKASPMPNAYGPHVADPRSGEIICSHVGLFHNVLSLAQSWYFAQTAASNPLARKFPYSKELMGELLEYIVIHEVGHTLGLRHNFAGSWTFCLDEIRDRDFVHKHSHGASIMDYMRFNYAAQPEDNIDTKDFIPRIGDYDRFAIEWGYRYLPQFGDAYEEQKYLTKWVTEQREANPRVFFGTETDARDPRFQAEDLSDNTIAANTLGMRNLEVIMAGLEEWTAAADDDNYSVMKSMYSAVTGQHLRYLTHAIKYVGGRYANAALRSEDMDKYMPVEKEKQREAMEFLKKYMFTELPWLYDCRVSELSANNIEKYLFTVVSKSMTVLMTSLPNIVKDENLLGDRAYTSKEMMADLYEGIWRNLHDKKTLSAYERMLQSIYVQVAVIIVEDGPLDVVPEFATLYVHELDKIGKLAKKKAGQTKDVLTKNHLLGISRAIEASLTGNKTALLK